MANSWIGSGGKALAVNMKLQITAHDSAEKSVRNKSPEQVSNFLLPMFLILLLVTLCITLNAEKKKKQFPFQDP